MAPATMKQVFNFTPSPNTRQIMVGDADVGTVSPYTYGAMTVRFWGGDTKLHVGKFCSLAECSFFLGGGHRTDWVTTYPFMSFNDQWHGANAIEGHPVSKGDIIVGNDVWIANDAIILSGVTIGNGAVIGAGSVVARDVPAYHIAIGNPATVVRPRFPDETIAFLEQLRWWDWPYETIHRNMRLLCSGDIDGLRDLCKRAKGAES